MYSSWNFRNMRIPQECITRFCIFPIKSECHSIISNRKVWLCWSVWISPAWLTLATHSCSLFYDVLLQNSTCTIVNSKAWATENKLQHDFTPITPDEWGSNVKGKLWTAWFVRVCVYVCVYSVWDWVKIPEWYLVKGRKCIQKHNT